LATHTTLEEIQEAAPRLPPAEQRKLAQNILRNGDSAKTDTSAYSQRIKALLAMCDPIQDDDGEGLLDAAEDLNRIREERLAQIG
jgi:hypothetical protein